MSCREVDEDRRATTRVPGTAVDREGPLCFREITFPSSLGEVDGGAPEGSFRPFHFHSRLLEKHLRLAESRASHARLTGMQVEFAQVQHQESAGFPIGRRKLP